MAIRFELKKFTNNEKCEMFMKKIIKDIRLRKVSICPVKNKKGISYTVFVEYESSKIKSG